MNSTANPSQPQLQQNCEKHSDGGTIQLNEVLADDVVNPPALLQAIAVRVPISLTSHVLKFVEHCAEKKYYENVVPTAVINTEATTSPSATATASAAASMVGRLAHLKRVRPINTSSFQKKTTMNNDKNTNSEGDNNTDNNNNTANSMGNSNKPISCVDVLLSLFVEAGGESSSSSSSTSSLPQQQLDPVRLNGSFIEWLNTCFHEWSQQRATTAPPAHTQQQKKKEGNKKGGDGGKQQKPQPTEVNQNQQQPATAVNSKDDSSPTAPSATTTAPTPPSLAPSTSTATETTPVPTVFTAAYVCTIPSAIPSLRNIWEDMNNNHWPLSGPKPKERPTLRSSSIITLLAGGGGKIANSSKQQTPQVDPEQQRFVDNTHCLLACLLKPLERADHNTHRDDDDDGGDDDSHNSDNNSHCCGAPIVSIVSDLSCPNLIHHLTQWKDEETKKDNKKTMISSSDNSSSHSHSSPITPYADLLAAVASLRSIAIYYPCEAISRGGGGSQKSLCMAMRQQNIGKSNNQYDNGGSVSSTTSTRPPYFYGPYKARHLNYDDDGEGSRATTRKGASAVGTSHPQPDADDNDNTNTAANRCINDGMTTDHHHRLFKAIRFYQRSHQTSSSSSSSSSSLQHLPCVQHSTFKALLCSSITSYDVLLRQSVTTAATADKNKKDTIDGTTTTDGMIKNNSIDGGSGSGGGTDYLCNDLDVLTTVEPCLMCSMGCVHSRVRRVVYLAGEDLTTTMTSSTTAPSSCENTQEGEAIDHHGGLSGTLKKKRRLEEGLGGQGQRQAPSPYSSASARYKLHTLESLNHRFLSYEVVEL